MGSIRPRESRAQQISFEYMIIHRGTRSRPGHSGTPPRWPGCVCTWGWGSPRRCPRSQTACTPTRSPGRPSLATAGGEEAGRPGAQGWKASWLAGFASGVPDHESEVPGKTMPFSQRGGRWSRSRAPESERSRVCEGLCGFLSGESVSMQIHVWGGDPHVRNWGSSVPLPTLRRHVLLWEDAAGMRGQALGHSATASRAGWGSAGMAWRMALPLSADSGEREVWEQCGAF